MKNLMLRKPMNEVTTIDDLFENWMGSFFEDRDLLGKRGGVPAVDIRETENGYLLEADLPGVSEKNLTVKVDRGVLRIASSAEEKKDEKDHGYLLHERRSCSFERAFSLPEDADADHIDATFKNGILALSIPKKAGKEERQIQVKIA